MHDRKLGWLDGLRAITVMASLLTIMATAAYAQRHSRASHFSNITTISSTVPSNGDVNPYGVFRISRTVGRLTRGNILVSNFNNSANLQGTGTTLVQISPSGSFSLFAQIDANTLPGACPGGVGLTTALVVLRSGWVIVGSLPTTDGTANTAQAGCLIVLDSNGSVVETLTDPQINGPWDMTVFDETGDEGTSKRADLFVTNVLNGTVAGGGNIVDEGTVLRIVLDVSPSGAMPTMESLTVIGSMFPERTDPAALVIGPTGLALGKNNKTLYVADSLDNRIAAIRDPLHRMTSADTGTTISSGGHLNDPLGMTLAINGDILTANGDDGFLVETTPKGQEVSAILLDSSGSPPGAGALFGLTDVPGLGVVFVDDATNTLNLLSSRGR
jgi:hypothetical protein